MTTEAFTALAEKTFAAQARLVALRAELAALEVQTENDSFALDITAKNDKTLNNLYWKLIHAHERAQRDATQK